MNQAWVNRAVDILKAGGIIVHYTDTVVGLAVLPQNDTLTRLNRVKQRKGKQGFILLATSSLQLQPFLGASAEEIQQLDDISETPTTWLINAASETPPLLVSEQKKIAVRITRNPLVSLLTDQLGPIASTSANLSNQPTCSNPQTAYLHFGPQIDYIVSTNNLGSNKASTIIDFYSKQVIRN